MNVEKAYAKINLTLDVVGRREDGYHLIETVMQTVSLYDVIKVEKSESIIIECSDPAVPKDGKNTCYKAAALFFESIGTVGGAKITIEKNIPSQAGLGGGSADAAAVLRSLNKIYGAGLDSAELENIASKIGADVPFCLRTGAAACRGIGEKMTRISLEKMDILLVKPDFGVSTPEAYDLFDRKKLTGSHGTELFLKAAFSGADVCKYISNDLERAIDNPEINRIKAELVDSGAVCAQMTGSGSCVFGIYSDLGAAERAKKRFSDAYPFCELCVTI